MPDDKLEASLESVLQELEEDKKAVLSSPEEEPEAPLESALEAPEEEAPPPSEEKPEPPSGSPPPGRRRAAEETGPGQKNETLEACALLVRGRAGGADCLFPSGLFWDAVYPPVSGNEGLVCPDDLPDLQPLAGHRLSARRHGSSHFGSQPGGFPCGLHRSQSGQTGNPRSRPGTAGLRGTNPYRSGTHSSARPSAPPMSIRERWCLRRRGTDSGNPWEGTRCRLIQVADPSRVFLG